jgi:hypothetical protein
MDWRSATENGRAQRNGARFIVFGFLRYGRGGRRGSFFDGWLGFRFGDWRRGFLLLSGRRLHGCRTAARRWHLVAFGWLRDFVDYPGSAVADRSGDRHVRFATVVAANCVGLIVINGAGVRDLLGDAELVQLVDDLARLDFELPRQLIDSNLTHV